MHHHLFERQSGLLGRHRLHAGQDLRAGPDLAAVRPNVDGAVGRLHRGVSEEWDLVHGLDPRSGTGNRRRHVTLAPCDDAGCPRGFVESAHDVGRAHACIRPVVPADGERGEPLLGRPHVVGHDRDAVVEPDHLVHAPDGEGLARVELRHLAAEDGAGRDGGDLHPRHSYVDAVLRRAVHLGPNVQALGRRSDEPEVLRVFEGDVVGYREPRRPVGKGAVSEPSGRGHVGDYTPLGPARQWVNSPGLRRRCHQHAPSRSAGFPDWCEHPAYRARRARHLEANHRVGVQLVVGGGGLELDLIQGDLQLLGDEHR